MGRYGWPLGHLCGGNGASRPLLTPPCPLFEAPPTTVCTLFTPCFTPTMSSFPYPVYAGFALSAKQVERSFLTLLCRIVRIPRSRLHILQKQRMDGFLLLLFWILWLSGLITVGHGGATLVGGARWFCRTTALGNPGTHASPQHGPQHACPTPHLPVQPLQCRSVPGSMPGAGTGV